MTPKLPTEGKRDIAFNMMLSPAEMEAIDDWRFANRIRSRADAMRRLCAIGLGNEGVIAALRQAHALIELDYREGNPETGEYIEAAARPAWHAICAALAKVEP